jgi:chromosomal replication initiation ATPase DnaA
METNYIGKKFLFENFEVRENNTKVLKATQNILLKEKKVYNPLYISGYHGSGKTHLLKAIVTENSSLNCKGLVNFRGCFV